MRNFIANRTSRYNQIPKNLDSKTCKDKIDAILNDPMGYKVLDEYNSRDVRQILKRYFGLKCIYCESSPIATSTFRIDHFRPKKSIKEVPGHKGYYWLAYEWSNLMQSCQLCNGSKSNYFPLKSESSRVSEITPSALDLVNRKPDKSPLSGEQRLLLNPELDEVEIHFTFNPDGTIYGTTDEGKISIKYYDLKRDDLVYSRKKINDNLLRVVKEALKDFEIDILSGSINAKAKLFGILKIEFRKLLWSYHENEQYSLFCFNIFEKFDKFILDFINSQDHKYLIKEAYDLYKINQLT